MMSDQPSSTTEYRAEVNQFLGRVSRAETSALLLDYDGTLAPFTVDRNNALPYPGVVPLLREIMATGRTRLVMITGRNALELLPLLGMDPAPEVWGSHGLQRLRPDGTCEMAFLDPGIVKALAEMKNWLIEQGLEKLAEWKPGGIAVHWRGLAKTTSSEIRSRVLHRLSLPANTTSMSLLEFDGGVEIRDGSVDKGDAVRAIMSEMAPDAPVAYLGDDETDERAFEALGRQGLCILVRRQWRSSAARVWIRPPVALLGFLRHWLQALS